MESSQKNNECEVKRSGFKYSLCFKYGVTRAGYLISLYLHKWKTRCPQGSTMLFQNAEELVFELFQKLNAKTWQNAKISPNSTLGFHSLYHFSGVRNSFNCTLKTGTAPRTQGPKEVMMIAYPVSSTESCERQEYGQNHEKDSILPTQKVAELEIIQVVTNDKTSPMKKAKRKATFTVYHKIVFPPHLLSTLPRAQAAQQEMASIVTRKIGEVTIQKSPPPGIF